MPRRIALGLPTIVHEAGHAVAASELGVPFRYVSMQPNNRVHAAHLVYRPRRRLWPAHSENLMVISAAGMVAEDLWRRHAPDERENVVRGGSLDLRHMQQRARYIYSCTWDIDAEERLTTRNLPRPRSDMTVYMLVAESWARAVRLIYRNWQAVACAAAVLDCPPRAVSSAEIAAAIRTGRPAPWIRKPGPFRWAVRPRCSDEIFWPAQYSRLKWAMTSDYKPRCARLSV